MSYGSKPRKIVILILIIVTALSLTNIISDTYATPLIVISISILFFVIGIEHIQHNHYQKAKLFIALGLALCAVSVILFLIGVNL